MQEVQLPRGLIVGLAVAIGLTLFGSAPVLAHCDTVDGPVVIAAREALALGDVTAVLKWVSPGHEEEVEAVFEHALAVRQLGDPARQLADRYFFETLVRLHREREGFGYSGLKAAGSPVSAAVLAADAALESGTVEALVTEITGAITEGLRKRFVHARETRAIAEQRVAAGREFVAAYVQFTHYAEGLEAVAGGHLAEHGTGVPHGPGGPDHAGEASPGSNPD